MPPTPDAPPASQVPLVVDLDGTLIRTDLMWESLARLLRRNPFAIFQVLFWWCRGRACLKKALARRVKIDPATLPYHQKFLAYLREQKAAGRKLVLATASDLQMALPVADHVGLFDEVLGSDGKTNLRSENKLKALVEKFGERGFDYAGNSSADFAVWRGAREAIVVNASQAVLKKAAQCTKLGPTFTDGYSPLAIFKRVLNELFIRSGYLLATGAGLLLAAAFPKIGIAGFAWAAPALLLFAAHGKNSGDAFRAGYVGGIVFWLASLYWLLLIPVAGLPILGWFALSAFMAVYFGIWTWLLGGKIGTGSWTQRNLWSLAGAAAWVALEIFRVIFSRRFSVESAGDFAIPTHAADPDRFRHRGLWRFISGRVGFAGDVLGGARHFLQTRFTFRMAAGSFPAAAGRRHFIRRGLLPDADAARCKRKPTAASHHTDSAQRAAKFDLGPGRQFKSLCPVARTN